MILTELITACGGKENLRRALRVGESVILELSDPALRSPEVEELPFNVALSQVTWQPEAPLSESQWRSLGEMIEVNQRKQLDGVKDTGTVKSVHRPEWHITPLQGMLNDPNGFIFHQGEYHLFHGLGLYADEYKERCWAHHTSTDLVNWTAQRVALCPSDWFDSHGVYSGHAVSSNDELMLFYTGNVRIGEQRDRITTQCLATSKDGILFTKYGPVINDLPPTVTPHCRDPKLVRNGEHWLMLLGAQEETADGKLQGRLAVYRSDNLYDWTYVGLFGEELGQFGYMWECPDLFELNGQLLGMFCPQGIESESKYHNIPHHCGYVKAALDVQDQLFFSDFTILDHGFDFYAPQTTQAPDGRRLLVGWMGLPDETDHPSRQENWIHQLTCMRELSWEKGKLYQRPARELQSLRGDRQEEVFISSSTQQTLTLNSKSFELQTRLFWPEQGRVTLRLMDNGEQYCDFILDADNQRILLDRSNALPTDGELIRETSWQENKDVELQLLADTSSLELFINDGEYVMTACVFTPENARKIQLFSEQPHSWNPVIYWRLA